MLVSKRLEVSLVVACLFQKGWKFLWWLHACFKKVGSFFGGCMLVSKRLEVSLVVACLFQKG